MIAYVFLAAFAAVYLVWVFLFEIETGGRGPFKSKKKLYAEHITHEEFDEGSNSTLVLPELYFYRITLWDRIRQWTTRAYRIETTPYMAWEPDDGIDEIWLKNEDRMMVWECPKCLSFWMSVPFTLLYAVLNGIGPELILIQFATAGVALLIHGIHEFLFEEVVPAPMVMIDLATPDEQDDML